MKIEAKTESELCEMAKKILNPICNRNGNIVNSDGYLVCSTYSKFPYEQYYHFKNHGQIVEVGFLTLLRCFYHLESNTSHFKENDNVILWPVIHRFTNDTMVISSSAKMHVTRELLEFITFEMMIFISKYDKLKALTLVDKELPVVQQELAQFYNKKMDYEFKFYFADINE